MPTSVLLSPPFAEEEPGHGHPGSECRAQPTPGLRPGLHASQELEADAWVSLWKGVEAVGDLG